MHANWKTQDGRRWTCLFVRSPLSWKGICNNLWMWTILFRLFFRAEQIWPSLVWCVCKRQSNWGENDSRKFEGDYRGKSVFCSFVIYLVLILNHSVSLNYTLIHRRESESEKPCVHREQKEQRQAKTLHNLLKVSRSVQKSKQKQKKKMGKLNKT